MLTWTGIPSCASHEFSVSSISWPRSRCSMGYIPQVSNLWRSYLTRLLRRHHTYYQWAVVTSTPTYCFVNCTLLIVTRPLSSVSTWTETTLLLPWPGRFPQQGGNFWQPNDTCWATSILPTNAPVAPPTTLLVDEKYKQLVWAAWPWPASPVRSLHGCRDYTPTTSSPLKCYQQKCPLWCKMSNN